MKNQILFFFSAALLVSAAVSHADEAVTNLKGALEKSKNAPEKVQIYAFYSNPQYIENCKGCELPDSASAPLLNALKESDPKINGKEVEINRNLVTVNNPNRKLFDEISKKFGRTSKNSLSLPYFVVVSDGKIVSEDIKFDEASIEKAVALSKETPDAEAQKEEKRVRAIVDATRKDSAEKHEEFMRLINSYYERIRLMENYMGQVKEAKIKIDRVIKELDEEDLINRVKAKQAEKVQAAK